MTSSCYGEKATAGAAQLTSSDHRDAPVLAEARLEMLWRQGVYKLLYLITSLPLGLFYFVFLIAGVSVGVVTLIIWVGVAILIFMMLAWWQLAAVERWLAVRWLYAVVPPMTVGSAPQPLSRRHIMEQLRNPMTWKILAFLLLKLPCGILYFGVMSVLLSVSLVAASVSLVVSVLTSPFVALGLVILGRPSPAQDMRHYIAFAATGFGIGIVAFALIDQMVSLARYLAVTLLGMSDDALRLQEMAIQIFLWNTDAIVRYDDGQLVGACRL
jgi:hypothetical protein